MPRTAPVVGVEDDTKPKTRPSDRVQTDHEVDGPVHHEEQGTPVSAEADQVVKGGKDCEGTLSNWLVGLDSKGGGR